MNRRISTQAMLLGGAVLLVVGTWGIGHGKDRKDEKYLFVWAGDQARAKPDFLAVVDFDEDSRNYGKALSTVPLPGPGGSGNEPHHVGLSADGKVLAAGGLLSVLRGQQEIFFFDVSNPAEPKFLKSADPPAVLGDR